MKYDHKKQVLATIIIGACWFTFESASGAPETYTYKAETRAAEAAEQGVVTASGLSWDCTGNRCTISGPWPSPGVTACKSLARIIGAIEYYGLTNERKYLDAKQLGECNIGAHPVTLTGQVSSSVVNPVPSAAGAGAEAPTDFEDRRNSAPSRKAEKVTPPSSMNRGTVTSSAGLREDLRLDSVRVTNFSTAIVDGRTVLTNVQFVASITNVGQQVFGNAIEIFADLMMGQVRTNDRNLDAYAQVHVTPGIRPGQTVTQTFSFSPRRGSTFEGTYSGQWLTAWVRVGGDGDGNRNNDRIRYFFILNHAGGSTTTGRLERILD